MVCQSYDIFLPPVGRSYANIRSIGAGKIIELNHRCEGGFDYGWLIIETNNKDKIKVEFQNENLRASNCATNYIYATVPDIITLLDNTGHPISCGSLRTGLDVESILVVGVPEILQTPQALAVLGVNQFNLPTLKYASAVPGITFHRSPHCDKSDLEPNQDLKTSKTI